MHAPRIVRMLAVSAGFAIAAAAVTGGAVLRAQEGATVRPPASATPIVYRSVKHDVSPRLDSMPMVEPVRKGDIDKVRPNKSLPSRTRLLNQPTDPNWEDPVAQLTSGLGAMPSPLVNFEGVHNVSGVLPPDTQGDVGPDHYVQWVNLAFAVYDKTGTRLYGPADGNSLWQGFGGACETTNHGDPITMYDTHAGRWVMSQFSVDGPYYQCIAVSATGDPLGAWYRYAWQVPVDKMNDYPHFGVWPDGYYMSVNQFTGGVSWGGQGAVAFERDKMLAGLAARAVYFDLYSMNSNLGGMLPTDMDGITPPPAGSPNYFMEVDDSWPGTGTDVLQVFKFHVDWVTPTNSTFTQSALINLSALGYDYDSNMCGYARNCIPQPGTTQKVDAISDRLMYRLAYRNFGDHESVVANHTVDADSADHAGVRWYEIRNPGSATPTIYQAGTYAPDADHRWMGSISMDAVGNMALGFSVSSGTTYPSIRYVGRLAGDPLGQMTQSEVTLMAGSGSQTHSAARWGDYSMMAIDPVDDCTFWYTQEYLATTGSAPWQTRVGAFKFPSCTLAEAGSVAGTVTESGTGTPVAGAQVVLGALSTATAANGTYSFATVPVGTYDMTVSKLGYLTAAVDDVAVVDGTVTTVDVALTPSTPVTITGVVRDGSGHGWPLYAKVEVAGMPAKTTFTNPLTGAYSIDLWDGQSYALTVTAQVPGYQVGHGTVNPPLTMDFGLLVDAMACSAPGYGLVSAYSQDFEANDGGWAGAGTNSSWAYGAPTSGPNAAHSGTQVWATNLSGSYHNDEVSTLTSPTIDLSAYAGTTPVISWWQWLVVEPNYDYASVQVSKDNGASWETFYGPVTGAVDSAWARRTATLDASYAVSAFRMRFLLATDSSVTYQGWYIDDVQVFFGGDTPSCEAVPGGMVFGAVTDANTADPMVGATVTVVDSPTHKATTVTTPDDPGQPDGVFFLFSPLWDLVAVSATNSGGYGTLELDTLIELDDVVRQDFALPAGHITALPTSLEVTIPVGGKTTREFALTNDGGWPVIYEVKEAPSSSAPAKQPDGGNGPQVVAAPLPPEKAYYENPSRVGLPKIEQPKAPPFAAGDVIHSWTSGVAGPWGIAFDNWSTSVWVSSPVASWGGTGETVEFTPSGVATGRSHAYSWNPPNGPADAAFNFKTGKLWVLNVHTGTANCIFEIDPATGPTGTTICPGGGTGTATSERGVAYDPTTDSWYVGGWNDQTIFHVSSTGAILGQKVVSLAIAGLAYNPDTHHLFAMVNATPTAVYVLDAANDFAIVGQFSITGFGDYAGVGIEIGCDGHLWANNANDGKTYEIESGELTTVCASDVPWVSESPVSGTIGAAPAPPEVISVTFDAGAPNVNVGTYKANLVVKTDTPYPMPVVAVTMNVFGNPSTFMGKVTAFSGAPIADALVEAMQGGNVMSWTTTAADGKYSLPVAAGRYDLRISKSPYNTRVKTNVKILAKMKKTVNFVLRQDGFLDGTATSTAGGAAIDGVLIKVLKAGSLVTSTTTDAAGSFGPLELPPGRYVIRATKSGYWKKILSKIVSDGLTTTVAVKMRPRN